MSNCTALKSTVALMGHTIAYRMVHHWGHTVTYIYICGTLKHNGCSMGHTMGTPYQWPVFIRHSLFQIKYI